MTPPAVAFVAHSGTGKTTLVEAVIRELTARGRRVGALKHDAHHFDIDHPGKDSARFTAAGAETMVLASDDTVAVVMQLRRPKELDNIIQFWFDTVDVVLVEGYKTADLPKIEVQRPDLGQPRLCRGDARDPQLKAVASNGPLEVDVPVLDLDDPRQVADFIEKEFLSDQRNRTQKR